MGFLYRLILRFSNEKKYALIKELAGEGKKILGLADDEISDYGNLLKFAQKKKQIIDNAMAKDSKDINIVKDKLLESLLLIISDQTKLVQKIKEDFTLEENIINKIEKDVLSFIVSSDYAHKELLKEKIFKLGHTDKLPFDNKKEISFVHDLKRNLK